MSEPRSRSRTTPRRSPGSPRTAPRRPARNPAAGAPVVPGAATAATATLEPPDAAGDLLAVEPDAAPAAPDRRSARRDRRGQRPRAPRHRLLLVSTAVLALGLLGVLLLNTIISQGAFRQHELEIDLILTAEQEESLSRAVQQAETPIEVEKKARALGMVPAAAPVFLRLSDGAILGDPVAAPAPTGPVSFKDAPGIQPTPKPRLAGTTGEEDTTADATATDGATDASQDPSSLVDPALDPSTGLVDPTPAPSASADAASPAPATQDVNP
jgi:hypothetical protein